MIMIIKKVSKIRNGYLYKGNRKIKQRYSFDTMIIVTVLFIWVKIAFKIVTWKLVQITWGTFNFFTSSMRIFVCSMDQFLTQYIKEFQNSWPFFNLKFIFGICNCLDNGIRSIVWSIHLWPFWPTWFYTTFWM